MSKLAAFSVILGLAVVLVSATTVRHGTVLTGLVVDAATQAPIPGVAIALNGARVTSDSQGRFGIPGAGPSLLVVSRDGYMEFHYPGLQLSGDTITAEIQLRPKPLTTSLYTSTGFIPFLCIVDESPKFLRVLHSCTTIRLDNYTRRIIKHNPWNPYFGEAADRSGVLIARPISRN